MGRTPCCEKNGLKKGPWTPEEDQKLIDYIQRHGHGSWRALPKRAGLLRCGKSCRLRWTNYLRPDIKRGQFSFEEEHTIIELHAVLGNKWSAIAAQLPGRTDNEIKNYWNTHLKKRLLQMGIDPVTHMPTIDVFGFPSHMNSQFLNAPALTHMTQWENARVEAEARLTKEYLRHAALMANQNGTCTAADLLLRSCRNQIDRDPNLFRNINSVSDQANWAVEQPRIAFDHSKASSHQNLEQLLQSQTNYSSSSNIPNQIDIDHGAGTLNQDNGSLRRFLDSLCSLALSSSSLDIPAQNTSTSSTISPLGGLQMKIKREPLIRNENVDLLQSRDDQFLHKQTVIGNNGKIINLNGHEDTFINSKSDIKVPYDDHNGSFTGNYNGLLPSALLQGSVPQKDNVISCIDNDHHVPTTSLWRKDQLVNIVPKNDDQSDSVSGLISSTSTTNIFSQPAADLIPFMINSTSSMENSNCYRGELPSDPESNPDEGKEYWSSMLKSVNGVIPAFQIISAQQ